MSEPVVIDGRPDFPGWKRFGITQAKHFPKYVYSANKMGLLIHKIAVVELHWWTPIRGGQALARLDKPRMIATTVCNQIKFLKPGRAHTCMIPEPNAVLCGRCHGEAPTFGRNRKQVISKEYARDHLGCVAMEVLSK
jgi:hypothetical protein